MLYYDEQATTLLFQDFDDNKLTALPWEELDFTIEEDVKGAGPAKAARCMIKPIRRTSILYNDQPFIFQGCTITATFKVGRTNELNFRVQLLEHEFINFLLLLQERCAVLIDNNIFKPLRDLLYDNYFFGRCIKNCIFTDIYGNNINQETLIINKEITFIPIFKLSAIMCSVTSSNSVIRLYTTKIIVL